MTKSPANDKLQYTTVEANGLDFNVAHAGSGDRLALCLHGFPELAHSWRHQLPLLADLGYKAWAPDLRGYGDTERPKGLDAYALPTLVQDVVELIAAADAKEVVLLAHDWGAVIAWQVAMHHPDLLDRLVIMNVPHPVPFQRELKKWKQRKNSWYVLFFQLPWLPEKAFLANDAKLLGRAFTDMAVHKDRFSEDQVRVFQQAAQQPGAMTAMINYYRAAIRTKASRAWQKKPPEVIQTPTLMLWGEQDDALSKETTFGTDDWVSNLTLRYLPNASHWVQQDQPHVVNTLLSAWLTGQEVPEAAVVEASLGST